MISMSLPTLDTARLDTRRHSAVTSDATTAAPAVLTARNLRAGFHRGGRYREIVHGVSFTLRADRCVAIVGESGSGKSVTARTLVGLTGLHSEVSAESLTLGDTDLRGLSGRQWRRVRGRRIGFVLQDALVSLDPVRPVGREIDEALRVHGRGGRAERRERVLDLLGRAGIPDPEVRARQRPGELSGGLRQRALIASALALDPEVVIADEPTTALDVTVQAQVLDLLEDVKAEGRSILLISHDLSVVAHLADEVLVMQGGHVVEQGPAADVLNAPQHPYTQALVRAVPGLETRGSRLSLDRGGPRPAPRERVVPGEPVLEVTGIAKIFRGPDGAARRAVDGVGFTLARGETLGVVGESGSGKSTTARIALALEDPDEGSVRLLGEPWSAVPERRRRATRSRITAVYQDPLGSFDPRWTVERILTDAIRTDERARPRAARDRVRSLLDQVGLSESVRERHPLTMSGGQRQRVAIARALAPRPDIVVLDEAVSALDVSVQAQILDLLSDLQAEFGLSYLFISHDLGVIGHISDRVVVMKNGRIVEEGSPEQLFTEPDHPYTRGLVSSLRSLGVRRSTGARTGNGKADQ
ncbi:ABC peptide transporter [Rhodococcus rhodnii LMG 5362]|uniref:ABC peptide transporter n=1 Tax=Rhodococcus rhodnii LMG 5362 TaxID=1273125 RepID=R7WL21_9NOCA|nr:ABC peptide transporter [Rhodococcus rhodnii LMG 5362]